jgi:hypothetical protein
MNPLKIMNTMADAADQKSKNPSPNKKKSKQVAAAKEQEKAKGKAAPKTAKPRQGGFEDEHGIG